MLQKSSKKEGEFEEQPESSSTTYSQPKTSESAVVTSTSSAIAVTTSLTNTRPRTMDIFSTALASANINLDNFMEEEDGKSWGKKFLQLLRVRCN